MRRNDFVCPVCGEYYDGDECDNCGYTNTRELKKTKKQEQTEEKHRRLKNV